MRHETIEFGRVRKATRGRRAVRMAEAGRTATATTTLPSRTAVIDEVFAGFHRIDSRPADKTAAAPGPQMVNHLLTIRLAEQLAALDRQREQLAQLLRSVDATA
jgi:hypothetical protein